ncbi:MAG: response regulator [Candidatus Omnitrophica bacterium]|nr:response regulator [Candidatus Omnitrophota bacterium]
MKKILVIDDEPLIVKLVKSRLEGQNYEVVTAVNGYDGLEKVHQENPDLIIADIMMPKMDGYTFVRELRKEQNKTPVIILTAKSGMVDLFEEEGVSDYVQKPFETEDLLEAVKRNLKRS